MADKDFTSRAEYQKAWRDAHKEIRRAYAAAYYAANKARLNAEMAVHYEKNRESYKEKATRWAKANPQKRNAINRTYRSENPNKYVEFSRRYWVKHRPKRLAELKKYRAANGDKMRALNAAWNASHPEASAHHTGLRRTRKMQATPAWANLDAIKAIYKEAARLKKETGQAWHVDHVIPLKHPLVCGLHCEFNLRVIPAMENSQKKNRFEVHHAG